MGIPQASKQKTNWTESWDLGDQFALFLTLVVEGLLAQGSGNGFRLQDLGDPLESFLKLGAEGLCFCWFRQRVQALKGVHMEASLRNLGLWAFRVRAKTHKAKGLGFRLSIHWLFGF